MLFLALLALFGNAYQYQSGFDFCLKNDFKIKECKYHLGQVKRNPRSMHYKKYGI